MSGVISTQLRTYKDPTKDDINRLFFSLPPQGQCGQLEHGLQQVDISAVLTLHGQDDSFAGTLYLIPPFLCFASLDRKSVQFTIPLTTVRRVERLSSRAGVFALSLTIVQLTSLRPTADAFCNHLRDALKVQLQSGQMKTLKAFVKTCYSESALLSSSTFAENEHEDGSFITGAGEGDEPAPQFMGGLGLTHKFPGDAKKLREGSKLKLWKDYMRTHGRNLTLLRYPQATRLIQVGLPNRLRGELWETLSGSIYLRFNNPGLYQKLLKENAGRVSTSTEEIEKDLNRSLPEYPAYQTEEGINTLRRAMNILTAAVLIYVSEEQAFWLLEVLCNRLVPGYYSPSMWGTLLDQRVFESLVHRCLPIIHERFLAVDVQLSVASLPWFLSLYINSMPLIFAFRIVDCFFAMGPRVLFQVGLAILKINGEKLLQVEDDGAFINVMRTYFSSLDQSAHPTHPDPRTRAITNFQELLLVAFREFSTITDATILAERKRFRTEIVTGVESFAKRAAVRNLGSFGRFTRDEVGGVYDVLFKAVLVAPPDAVSVGGSGEERAETRIGMKVRLCVLNSFWDRIDRTGGEQTFKVFLADIVSWARDERVVSNGFVERVQRELAEHELIGRIFYYWDRQARGALSLQDLVLGLDEVMHNDLMGNIEWFFTLHDKDKDGMLTKDELLQLSESLLFIFRNEPGDAYLGAVSRFMTNAFEFGDALLPAAVGTEDGAGTPTVGSHVPFRMVVLADEILESFFESDLTASFRLEPVPEAQVPQQKGGFLGGLMSAIVTDDNMKMFNRFADEVGKTIGRHQVANKPSIGKMDRVVALQEPKARESLLTASMREKQVTGSPSTVHVATPPAQSETLSELASLTIGPTPSAPATGSSTLVVPTISVPPMSKSDGEKDNMPPPSPGPLDPLALVQERQTFAIDEAKGEEDDLDELEGEAEDGLLDEVDAFLEEHDAGLSEAENSAAKGIYWVVCAQAASEATIQLEIPKTPPPTASRILNPAFASFSVDPAFWVEFFGNSTHPNKLSFQLIKHVADRTGVSPWIRPGGVTQDSSIFDPSAGEPKRTISETGGIYRTTYGPEFYKSFSNFASSTKFTVTLNLGNDSLNIARDQAQAAYKYLDHDKIWAFEPFVDILRSKIAAANSVGSDFVVGSGKVNVTDIFGQALWTLDTSLYAGSINASRVYLHQGATLVFQSDNQENVPGINGTPGFS
ncbi:hypothetical protein FRC06_001979 [Ceratobasidium sp. 370]|nr:hypothetical protein FRC06_001979 [Ceratobasidium sp. 370]